MRGAETLGTLCSRITSCYARVRRRPHRTNAVVQFFYGPRAAFQMRARGDRARGRDFFSIPSERASRAHERANQRALFTPHIYKYIYIYRICIELSGARRRPSRNEIPDG